MSRREGMLCLVMSVGFLFSKNQNENENLILAYGGSHDKSHSENALTGGDACMIRREPTAIINER